MASLQRIRLPSLRDAARRSVSFRTRGCISPCSAGILQLSLQNPWANKTQHVRHFAKAVFDKTEIGLVTSVAGDIVFLRGLAKATPNALVTFANGSTGIVTEMRTDGTIRVCMVAGKHPSITETAAVESRPFTLAFSDDWIGRIVNPLGQPLDGGLPLPEAASNATSYQDVVLSNEVASIPERALPEDCLSTGIMMVDAFKPFIKGSSVLLRGEEGLGKSDMAFKILCNIAQSNILADAATVAELLANREVPAAPHRTTHCIYVLVGKSPAFVAARAKELARLGLLQYCTIIASPHGDPAGSTYLAPYVASCLGQYHMRQGRDAVVFIDNLTDHFGAIRAVTNVDWHKTETALGDQAVLFDRCARIRGPSGRGTLSMISTINWIPSGPAFTSMEHIKERQLVVNVSSFVDVVIPLSKTWKKAGASAPLDPFDFVPATVHAAQGGLFRYYASRAEALLIQLRDTVKSALSAKEMGIELEADMDDLLNLHAKARLLLSPSAALARAAKSEEEAGTHTSTLGVMGVTGDDFEQLQYAKTLHSVPEVAASAESFEEREARLIRKLEEEDDDDRPAAAPARRMPFKTPSGQRISPPPLVHLSNADDSSRVPFGIETGMEIAKKDPLLGALQTLLFRAAPAHGDPARTFMTLFVLTHGYVQRVPLNRLEAYLGDLLRASQAAPPTAVEEAGEPSVAFGFTNSVPFSVPTSSVGGITLRSPLPTSLLHEVLCLKGASSLNERPPVDIGEQLHDSTKRLAAYLASRKQQRHKAPLQAPEPAPRAPQSNMINKWTAWLTPMGPKVEEEESEELEEEDDASGQPPAASSQQKVVAPLGHLRVDYPSDLEELPKPLAALHVLVAEFTRTFLKEPKY